MATVYNSYKKAQQEGSIDLVNDTIKVILVNGYTVDADNHQYYSDVSASEVSGTGYTAGGQALANKTVTQDNTNDKAVFDADDVSWANSTISADGCILYKDTGVATTSPLICYMPFGSTVSSNNTEFKIQWSSNGILQDA